MKVLLVTPQSPVNGWSDQIVDAFKQMGDEVCFIDERKFWLMPTFLQSNVFLWRNLRRIGFIRARNKKLLQQRIMSAVDTFKPDMLLTVQGVTVSSKTVRAASAKGVKTVIWYCENQNTDYRKKWFNDIAGLYDYMFSFDPAIAARGMHGTTKLYYLPVAVDARMFAPPYQPVEHAKVCFIGAHDANREALLTELKDLGLVIYGWKGWEKTPLAHLYRGPASIRQSAALYAASDVNININSVPPAGGITMRTFEISAAGGFQISDIRPGLADAFGPTEVATYDGVPDIRQKVQHWLDSPQERAAMAKAAHERVLRDHSMVARMKTVLGAVYP